MATILVSCSGNGEIAGIGQVDGPVLTSPRPSLINGGGLDALVIGTVVFDENTGCLFLELENHRYPVVWPAGASWRANAPAVELQGQLIEPGMSVEGGGGYLKYEHIKVSAGTAVADAAQACADPTGQIAFFNMGSDVKVVTD